LATERLKLEAKEARRTAAYWTHLTPPQLNPNIAEKAAQVKEKPS